ncbi:MAG: 5'-nucleotidase C-terminal domain-containing protein [Elainellaceae cyanobacterium]
MPFQLQILHASDLEGGVDAITSAPNFAAVEEFLETTVPNSITLSGGDNYLPGPFSAAANDRDTFRDGGVFNAFYNDLFGLTGGVDVDGDGDLDAYDSLREGLGRVDISIMNQIGFDASAVGNHEFDFGTSTFFDIIAPDFRDEELADDRWVGAQFPYLSANLDFSAEEDLAELFTSDILVNTAFETGPEESLAGADAPKIAPSTIIEELDPNTGLVEQIGVVGATTQILEDITSTGDVEVIGPDQNDMTVLAGILQPEIDALVAQGVNKIVLVSHLQQIALEQELATLLNGVDVIVASGSDTLLADSEDVTRGLQPGATPDGDYPIQTADAAGNPVLIVSTDGEYSYLGRLVVTFDDSGVVIPGSVDPSVSGAFATTEAGVTALFGANDPFAPGTDAAAVQSLVGETVAIVTEQDSVIFGDTTVFLDGRRSEVRTEETNLGNLTADANLFVAQQVDPTVQVSLKNGGGIRDAIGSVGDDGELLPTEANPASGKQEGEISQLDIANSLRFNNGLTLLTLTAEELRQILEHGVAGTEEGATPGQFPQVGGVSFSFNPDGQAIEFDDDGNLVTPGSRIESATITADDGSIVDILVEDGEVVGDAAREIRVVTLNFLADGGDGYPFDVFGENRVDLFQEEEAPRTGTATFAPDGTEQDAFAEFLSASFDTTPFSTEETAPENDTRIQNLEVRSDTVVFDQIDGTNGSDTLTGSEGVDIIFGFGGADIVFAGFGDDEIDGGAGSDQLRGNDGNDVIFGGVGIDLIFGGNGDDNLDGGDGDDQIRGNDGIDIIAGGLGVDLIFGGRGDDEIDGGADDDDLRGLAGNDRIIGGSGSDRIRGNGGDDDLFGNAGEDDILGGKGNDFINGGSGDDLLRGAKGSDFISGGSGDDLILGGRGNDVLIGDTGNDTLRADGGDDLLIGGIGDDIIRTGAGSDVVSLAVGEGTDTIFRFGAQGNDVIQLGEVEFENIELSIDGSDTTISVGSEILAVVINNTDLTEDSFASVFPTEPEPVA